MKKTELQGEVAKMYGYLQSAEWEGRLFAAPPYVKSLESQVEWQLKNILEELDKPAATKQELLTLSKSLQDAIDLRPFDLSGFVKTSENLLLGLDRADATVIGQSRKEVLDTIGNATVFHQKLIYKNALKNADLVLKNETVQISRGIYSAHVQLNNNALMELNQRLKALSPELKAGIDALDKVRANLKDLEDFLKMVTAFASVLGKAMAIAAKI